jgi:TRAP-type C4-dicarboxylate transport system permease small subunit
MTKLIDSYGRLLEMLMALMLAVMVLLVFGNVVLRYAFNSGISVSEELSRWFFVWLTFLGAIVAVKDRAHLGTDMLVSRLSPFGKKLCLIAGQLLMLCITWLVFQGSSAQTLLNMDTEAPSSGLSMGLFYGVGVLFAVSTALLLLRELWLVLSGQLSDAELVMVKESEEAGELEALQAELARENARHEATQARGSRDRT